MSLYTTNYLSGIRFRNRRHVRKAGGVVFGLFVCAFFILYVGQRASMVKTGYEVEELKKQKTELTQAHEMLRIEAATLTSPDRVEKIATSMLGMQVPDDSQVVLVKRVDHGGTGTASPDAQARRTAAKPGRS